MIPVCIGYDGDAEPIAYHVCADSIIRNASQPIAIIPVALNTMRSVYEEKHVDGSNAFIYSRFLIPYLMGWKGYAIFLDGDMILRDGADIVELWNERDPWSAVQVVKHDYKTKHPTKYLGAKNPDYPCKNWSSVVIWNCGHYAHRKLTPEFVAHASGSFLHRFEWVQPDRIGALPSKWNRLVLEQPVQDDDKLLHYTIGTPCFDGYKDCDHAEEWHKAAALAMGHK